MTKEECAKRRDEILDKYNEIWDTLNTLHNLYPALDTEELNRIRAALDREKLELTRLYFEV